MKRQVLSLFISIAFIVTGLSCSLHKGGTSSVKQNDYSYDNYKSRRSYGGKLSDKKSLKSERRNPSSATKDKVDRNKSQERRMIIYTANYKIRVLRVRDAVSTVRNLALRSKGFIESSRSSDSYRYARVVLRVPVKSFDETLRLIEKIGRVTSKNMSATDVTMAYKDASLRIETAKQVRKRLYQLLGRTKKIKERVAILKEIERLTSIIDSLRSKMVYLKNRAAYSTIIIEFRATVREFVTRYTPSPFTWIASLHFNNRSIYKNYKSYKGDDPEGYFKFKKDFNDKKKNTWLYSTPDNKSSIRIGAVKNFPIADLIFWKDAMLIDINNRHYKLKKHKSIIGANGLKFQYFVLNTGKKIYVISIAVKEKGIIVVEALFHNNKLYEKNSEILEKYIKSVRRD